ncbi:MAG: hypothetical protein IJS63_11760 [Bacteroidaceae bacterium]|nr:hypothetical protein [Bacteroidaceae bacterium]
MMRKSICFIMLLALICSARGQTAYSYRYWFDAGDSIVYNGTATGEATVELDISTLAKGALHALHIQALDARNKWGAVHTSYFFYTRGGTEGTTGRYWFDSEESRQTAATVNGMLELDTESLGCGVHALHVQMFDADGGASPVQTAYFYKGEKGSTARYWFDSNKTMKAAPTINGTMELDVDGLGCGIHAVHFQSFSAKGVASPVHTAYFYKGAEGKKARYWFDNAKAMQTASTVNGTMELDIDGLSYGIHALHVQAFSDAGEASPVKTVYFYKKENADASLLSCRLWIDDGERAAKTFALSDSDIILDAEGLSFGMHDLHVTLLSAGGQVVAQTTVEFEVLDPDGITLVQAFAEEEACYDVAGRRVPKMQKGIYIKGGKKVLVK